MLRIGSYQFDMPFVQKRPGPLMLGMITPPAHMQNVNTSACPRT